MLYRVTFQKGEGLNDTAKEAWHLAWWNISHKSPQPNLHSCEGGGDEVKIHTF